MSMYITMPLALNIPMVATSSVATNREEAYQEPSTMDMADHAYEGTSDDQEQSKDSD